MQLKKTSKKIGSLINEIRTFSNGYFFFNNIDYSKSKLMKKKLCSYCIYIVSCHDMFQISVIIL